jgi:rare lipoprotein A (peptidoglycan hydrolase)
MPLRSQLSVSSRALPLWLAAASLTAASLGACADEPVARGPRDAGPLNANFAPTSKGSKASGCSADELLRPAKRVIRGLSTYYADSLAGNPTSSGERYDPARLTAAHRSLPFGTRLRISRTDQKSSAVLCVVVNDRGPFGNRKYILDVSRRAAEALQMIRAGVVPLRIDVL